MSSSALFTYHFCNRVFVATALPWDTPWKIVPLIIPSTEVGSVYDPSVAAGDPSNIGGWSMHSYVESPEDLPYAYITSPPSWENEGSSNITIKTICVYATNSTTEVDEVLLYQALDPERTLTPGDTLELDDFKFQIVQLEDL